MKQVVQHYRTGALLVRDVPAPVASPGRVLVRTAASVVSTGTERTMIDFGRKGLLAKALARPDLVRQVVNKARLEGVREAYRQARARLDVAVPLGYSSAGVVVDGGGGRFSSGDLVACAGSGRASHAELASLAEAACLAVPSGVAAEDAAFVALGGVALHAIRLGGLERGGRAAVIGLGLLGQLAVQLLRARGVGVIGVDIDQARLSLAGRRGADALAHPDDAVLNALAGDGVDATLIFAATPSNEPLRVASEITGDRGRVIATGLVGLDVPREAFFDRELSLVVSRGWGTGDEARANLEEFLGHLASGAVEVAELVTARFPIERALEGYELVRTGRPLAVLITYEERPARPVQAAPAVLRAPRPVRADAALGIGLIGAGQYARGTLLPALRRARVSLEGVASARGLSAAEAAERFGFRYATADPRELLADERVRAVVIATRHDSHAALAAAALRAGKHVLVEKPLATTLAGLREVEAAARASAATLLVGHNRRFAPASVAARQALAEASEPCTILCRVNAGRQPLSSWIYDEAEGAGRVIGELGHFIDLGQLLAGDAAIERVTARSTAAPGYGRGDNVTATIELRGGSVLVIVYTAQGDRSLPRERVEAFAGGTAIVIDDFRSLAVRRSGRDIGGWDGGVDRGYDAELRAFVEAARTGTPAVPLATSVETSLAAFAVERSLAEGRPVALAEIAATP